MLGAVEKRSLTKHQSLEIWKALVFFRQTATLSMVNVWWNWHRCCLKTPLGCILLTHCWATCWDHTQDFSLDTSHVVKCVQCRTYIAGYIYFLYIYIYRYRYIHTRTHTHTHTHNAKVFQQGKPLTPAAKGGQTAKTRWEPSRRKARPLSLGGGSVSDDLGRDEMTCWCRVIVIWKAGTSGRVWKKCHFCRANTEIALDYFWR